MAKPYIGVTGPVTIQETKSICKEFSNEGYSMRTPHIPMVGFLVSYKTLNRKPTNNLRYPPIDVLPDLLEATNKQALNMIHYNSRNLDTLSYQIDQIFSKVYDLCQSLQLNIPWPPINEIKKIKEDYPEMQIVFQASKEAIKRQTPKQIAQGLKKYEGLLTYVLIDPSGGQQKTFEASDTVPIYCEIKEHCPDLTVGFAGGFRGENVNSRLQEIIEQTQESDFCIDAEGGLSNKLSSRPGDDILNIEKVRNYLKGASATLII